MNSNTMTIDENKILSFVLTNGYHKECESFSSIAEALNIDVNFAEKTMNYLIADKRVEYDGLGYGEPYWMWYQSHHSR